MSAIDATPAGTYIPGYARTKIVMILFGLILFCLGLWQLELPLRLLILGDRARGEATVVIKIKAGMPDIILRNDSEIQANLETRDRSFVFWNQFSFRTTDDRDITVRAPVGSQLKPIYPLLDQDGLPTTDLIWYDPNHPQTVVFPMIISTWFAPGALVFVGLLAIFVGSVLLYWSNKPIELPHIPPAA